MVSCSQEKESLPEKGPPSPVKSEREALLVGKHRGPTESSFHTLSHQTQDCEKKPLLIIFLIHSHAFYGAGVNCLAKRASNESPRMLFNEEL